jgi:hypothetical protein
MDFSIRRREVAEEAARVMGGIVIVVRGGQRSHAFVRGWKKVSALAEELVPPMKDSSKVSRLRRIIQRAAQTHPSVCRERKYWPRKTN